MPCPSSPTGPPASLPMLWYLQGAPGSTSLNLVFSAGEGVVVQACQYKHTVTVGKSHLPFLGSGVVPAIVFCQVVTSLFCNTLELARSCIDARQCWRVPLIPMLEGAEAGRVLGSKANVAYFFFLQIQLWLK